MSMNTTSECSVLYYPGQGVAAGVPTGHVDLSFKGVVYTLGCGGQSECDLAKRIKKAEKGGLPFKQFVLQLTKKQADQLERILTIDVPSNEPLERRASKFTGWISKLFRKIVGNQGAKENRNFRDGITCMGCVSNILEQAGIVRIPSIVKFSPLLGSQYLEALHRRDQKMVSRIHRHGSCFSNMRNAVLTTACRAGEALAILIPAVTAVWSCLF